MISGARLLQRSSGFIGRIALNSRAFVRGTDVCNQQKPAAGSTKKPKDSPKITLIAHNNSMSITSLNEAQKLAKRRDLFLVQVHEMDVKTQRPLYRLATAAEMLSSDETDATDVTDKTKSAHKKSEKSLSIGARISEHDLSSRLKNIAKWLAKGHEVRILIQGNADNAPIAEGIVKEIEKSIKEPQLIGKIVQKRNKGSMIKFSILPVATPTQNSTPPQ